MAPRVIIVPGNGCTPVRDCNWYKWMHESLQATGLFEEVILRNMPDPFVARESVWIPFLTDEVGVDENTILIGHSSGAEAGMRLLEKRKLLGLVLVSACHTDLGVESERAAGYYSRPWQWDVIAGNAKWILQYHSEDDPLVPIAEGDYVAAHLNSKYTRTKDNSHFFGDEDVEIVFRDLVAMFK
eukprot:m.233535 g.233535  ORF g.233535 m.233535 type:complete len:184 (+) comp54298_c0_seq3:12-563(+)